MTYDLAIFAGHGTSNIDGKYDPGATAQGKKEADYTKEFVAQAVTKLELAGYRVLTSEQNFRDNDLRGHTITSNYAISVHVNAGGGTGSETFVPCAETDLTIDEKILSRFESLGMRNRGLKSRNSTATLQRVNGRRIAGSDYYGEIRTAWLQGVSLSILELFFIDSIQDVKTYEQNKGAFVAAFVEEIAREIKPSRIPQKPVSSQYRKDYRELGEFYITTGKPRFICDIPTLSSRDIGTVPHSEWIKYNRVVYNDGRIWVFLSDGRGWVSTGSYSQASGLKTDSFAKHR